MLTVLLTRAEKVEVVFNYYDRDNSNYLEKEEIKLALQETYGYLTDSMYKETLKFIDDNLDLMLPVIIFPLIGGVLDTVHFSNLMTKVKPAKKIFVVFTHIENIITGVKHLIREDDEDISGEDLKNEIVQRI